MATVHEFVRGAGKTSSYNIGWTVFEIQLMIKLIDDEDDLTDEEEYALRGIRKKLVRKRKNLRTRNNQIGDRDAAQ